MKDNFFTEAVNKFVLSSNDDKKMQSIDSIETYTYGVSKGLVMYFFFRWVTKLFIVYIN